MPLKFLIVDDSKAMQIIVKRILVVAGYSEHEFRFADNGEDAINEIINWRPDIVLLDWHMPGISGLKVLEKVQELQLKVKIGLITAEKDQTSINQAKAAGAMFVVHKPFTMQDLQESLIPALAGVSSVGNQSSPINHGIIFPCSSALGTILSTITGIEIKVEKIARLEAKQLSFPCKVTLYSDINKQIKAVQVLDENLCDRLSESFASSIYKGQAFDDKLFARAMLRSLTIIGACFHNLEKNEVLFPIKTHAMPKLIEKIMIMDQCSQEERLDLKFTFENSDVCYSILYLEKSNK